MLEVIGFAELRWLREISATAKHNVPELMGARLLKRGLIERNGKSLAVTVRGRIALAKLG